MSKTEKPVKTGKTRYISYELNLSDLNNKKTKKDMFYKIYNGMYNYVFDDYRRKDEYVKIILNKDKFIVLTISETLIQLIFWRLYIVFDIKITEEDIIYRDIKTEYISRSNISSILDKNIKRFLPKVPYPVILSNQISYCIDDLCEISENYAYISCNTFSLYDMIQFAKRNKTFRGAINTTLDDTLPVPVIEEQVANGTKLIHELIKADKKNCLYPFMMSGQLKGTQVGQVFYAIGTRASSDKIIMPVIIKRNMIHGYSSPSELYVEAVTARDALIQKKISVADSGALSRKQNLLCLNTAIDTSKPEDYDCGTKHYITMHIDSENVLNLLQYKYRVLEDGTLKEIDPKKDKNLIGQTIKIRSIACCAMPDGHVCPKCVGSKSKQLMNTRLGILPATNIGNLFSELHMQAKHFTTTDSIDISKNEIISKFFDIDNSLLYLKDEIDRKHLKIIVNKENIEELLHNSSNSEYDESVIELYEVQLEYKTPQMTDPEIYDFKVDGAKLSFSDEVLERKNKFKSSLDSDYITINCNDLSSDDPLFKTTLITNSINRYMDILNGIIDSKYTTTFKNPSELVQEFMNTLGETNGGIDVLYMYFEVIVYNLLRDANDINKRPDFSLPNPDIICLSMKDAIFAKDFYTGFVFQNVGRQYIQPNTFRKTSNGIFDGLFRTIKPYYLEPIKINNLKEQLDSLRS